MSLEGETKHDKLISLTKKTNACIKVVAWNPCVRTKRNDSYQEQAIWFLNAFWDTWGEEEAELFWNYVHKCAEIDIQKHEEGCGLDEMQAHVFLEKFDETLTVRALREKLRQTKAIGEKERPKLVPLTHYLLFKYDADWEYVVTAPQGDNKAAIEEAQAKLAQVQEAFRESEARSRESAEAYRKSQAQAAEAAAREADAVKAEADAKAREEEAHASAARAVEREAAAKKSADDAVVAEEAARAAEVELQAALAEVKAQEDEYNAKTESLKQKSETGGVVSRNKAKNELAQHLGEDPLPLRRAKITQEAAVKKAERATKAASDARVKAAADAEAATASRADAEKDAAAASEARAAAEASAAEAKSARAAADEAAARAAEAKAAAEAALEEARSQLAEAEVYLEEMKSQPGSAQGALWWIERELHEQKAYLPESKGGYRKKVI